MSKLKEITLKNFQSWENNTIHLSDGLTVISGDNNVGKSVIFKALKITATPEKFAQQERSCFIREGHDDAYITYKFDDGAEYLVAVLLSENAYFYSDGNQEEPEYLGDTLPIDLRIRLGFLIGDDGVIGNLIDMDQNMFLVNSDEKFNYNIIKLITSNEDLDKLIYEIGEMRLPRVNSEMRIVRNGIDISSRTLIGYSYRDTAKLRESSENMESRLHCMESLFPVIDGLSEVKVYPELDLLDISSHVVLEEVMDSLSTVGNLKPCDVNVSSLVNIESILDDIPVNGRCDKIDCNIASIVEVESAINELDNLGAIQPIDYDVNLDNLVELDTLVGSVQGSLSRVKESEFYLSKYSKELDSLGAVSGECPRYGKVLVLGDECSPRL